MDGGDPQRGGEGAAASGATHGGSMAPRPATRSGRARTARSPWFRIGPVGPLRMLQVRLAAFGHWLAQSYAAEIADGDPFPWQVVAFACGAVIYLQLPHEPSFIALSLGAAIAVGLVMAQRRVRQPSFLLKLVACAVVGVWAAALAAHFTATPRLDRERVVTVQGWVIAQETVLKGATRVTLRVHDMTAWRLPKNVTPDRITVSFRASAPQLAIGDGIRFLAKLQPLQGPVMPGGYDFARRAYFDGRGAVGFALGRITPVDLGPPPLSARVMGAVADLRHAMAQRIRAALPGATGAIAAAMIVGEQRGIPDAENNALRMSGLTHIISISGLHMSLVASGVFLVVRALLALIPAFALAYPIKKWAAAAALAAITFYLMLAGGAVAAERSYVMCTIMLLAIMLDRAALSLRNVALSAALILIRDPTQVVEPSFLMSYLAVLALIASYRAWQRYRQTQPSGGTAEGTGPIPHVVRGLAARCLGAMMSSLIATLATASVIADQFFRSTPYGVVTNLIVLPVIDLVAMPAAVLACLAMPFGLESLPLAAMGWAIDFMTAVGFAAADLPGGQGLIGRIHPWSNGLAIAGLLWLCLWQRAWRLLGIIPAGLALVLAPFASRPDVLIGSSGMPVAVRAADGHYRILGAKDDRFTVANWLAADADPKAPADPRQPLDPTLAEGWICDPLGCSFVLQTGDVAGIRRVAVVNNPLGFEEDCRLAAVIVTKLVAPDYCSETALVFDRSRLAITGAVSVTFTGPAAPTVDADFSDAPPDDPDPPRAHVAVSLADPSRPWVARSDPAPVSSQTKAQPPEVTRGPVSRLTGPRAGLGPEAVPVEPLAKSDRVTAEPRQATPPTISTPARKKPRPTPSTPPIDPTALPDEP